MASHYRNECGECGWHTAWLPQSVADERMLDHYGERHPGIVPRGMQEYRESGGCCSSSCLMVLTGFVGLVVPAWYLVH
ncbi:hypothetical protein [Kitasatospora sp. NPDC094011]|uniref:hypothetical protein n=1 Tax=Kitasatospora sp. NPDC094011 TaxID=3364090 RepID=UPI00380D813C